MVDRPLPSIERLREKAGTVPGSPGVYLFRDTAGAVLYVGKSVSLRHRVSSYLGDRTRLNARIARMVERAADLEVVVTANEEEALLVEYELIDRYAPRYNIVFRDDKSYPYLKVTHEEFPRIVFTREPGPLLRRRGDAAGAAGVAPEGRSRPSGAPAGQLLGPFTSADSLRKTLRFLATIFPVRSCKVPSSRLHTVRACMDFHIKRCLAPCEGKVDAATYQKIVSDAVLFLKGRDDELMADLRRRMREAAAAWELEKAARLKGQIAALERLQVKQNVTGIVAEDFDVLGAASDEPGGRHVVQQLQVRAGRIRGQRKIQLARTHATTIVVLSEFVKQHYLRSEVLPPEILTEEPLPEAPLIERALARRAKHAVRLAVPQRGRKRGLVEMAVKNARLFLATQGATGEEAREAVAELAQVLSLSKAPARIECFDISHTGGTDTVASMVVAQNGVMDRSGYRRYRIRTVEGIDDFAAMREVIDRRYRHVLAEGQPLPDLVLIDGGKGQLAAGQHSLLALGVGTQAIAALAKREEILFAPHLPDGLALPEGSLARRLVQRIRDEAHRFAITYHRRLRSRRTAASALDAIAGVGPRSRALLLRHFGSVDRVRAATAAELAAVPGLSRRTAASVARWSGAAGGE
jgi:excinuclease ABC subunit C